MRFSATGPLIPDELLIARDRGDVVFFCGAGVSQARAKLDNFVQLARKVIDRLGAAQDSPARRLLEVASNASPIAGVGGFIATDRVFSLLEREFLTADINAAVAAELRPAAEADKSAHRLILDLATVSGTDPRLRQHELLRLTGTRALLERKEQEHATMVRRVNDDDEILSYLDNEPNGFTLQRIASLI